MMRFFVLVLSCTLLLAGCAGKRQAGGGYYQDDGPHSKVPADIAAIPNATPKLETPRTANSRPYAVMGQRYVPISGNDRYSQKGVASWYGKKFHGKKTASGETYDMYAMTAAHRTLPLPSYARVTRVDSGKSIIVRINDRGPFLKSRIIDLSYVAASKLGLIGPGSGQVVVEAITNDDIRNNAWQSDDDAMPKAQPIPDAKPDSAPVLTTRASEPAQPEQQDKAPAESKQEESGNTKADTTDALAALDLPADLPTIKASAPASAGSFFLQYGAFGAAENASKLASRLNSDIDGIETREAEVVQSASLHRVRIGPYTNRTQAVNAALRIEQATGLKASYSESAPEQSNASLYAWLRDNLPACVMIRVASRTDTCSSKAFMSRISSADVSVSGAASSGYKTSTNSPCLRCASACNHSAA